jgi:murein DD-endopeptidase MepM/ murein hydrolase activator NlpD
VDTFQLDTLDWVRLRCAACGQTAEILQLDLEAEGGNRICSPCCGALLVPIDAAVPGEPRQDEPLQGETQQEELTGPAAPDAEELSESTPETIESLVEELSSGPTASLSPERSRKDRNAISRPARLPALEVSPDDDEFDSRADVWGNPRRNSASIVISVAVHGVVLLLLAAIVLHLPQEVAMDVLYASFDTSAERVTDQTETGTLAETVDLSLPAEQARELQQPTPVAAATPNEAELASTPSSLNITGKRQSTMRNGSVRAVAKVTANSGLGSELNGGNADSGNKSPTGVASAGGWSISSGGGFAGRRPDVRRQLAALTGATPASEAAVEKGLKWLAAHQREDGSWSLQHTHAECGSACLPNSAMDCPTAATGLALLCFLGAGHSHTDGDYQQVVLRGVDWLAAQSREGDLRTSLEHAAPEGRSAMYSHGIAAMALCEAYGLTHDRTLIQTCEQSIEFIAQSQDPVGGGWRYSPGEPGDTSVVGWQVMALVSARLSGLKVPDQVRERVVRFLQGVHLPSTGEFGYTDKRRGTVATTAIGNLCALYLHSSVDRVSQQRVDQLLGSQDPKRNNEYSNYYVSLVLHHLGGEHWRAWNAACRDTLVATQVKFGHAAGSWDPINKWGSSGGRLYSTCMNVLTLEVYYRHLPLYADDAFAIGLTAKPVPKKLPSKAKTKASAKTAGKAGNALPAEFVPTSISEPIAIANGEDVVAIAQQPLTVEPELQPQSLFPRATRFYSPLRNLFDEVALRTVTDSDGREWQLYPNAGFGAPLLKVGEQSLVQIGGDFGWFQPDEPVFAAAAGIVRYSGKPASSGDGVSSGKAKPSSNRTTAADWGNTIVIEHLLSDGTSLTSVYAHLGDDRQVEAGDVVAAGQLIASVGPQNESVNGGGPPHLFFAIRPGRVTETKIPLAAFAIDTAGWLDPVEFLREQQADVLPAIYFSPTWNPFPRPAAIVIGEPARDSPTTEWLRESRYGQKITAMRGKVVCLVCVQSSCEASRLFGGLLLSDLAERYQDSSDVALILLQTATGNFKANSAAALRNGIGGFPENVAIGHVSADSGPPIILDWYGIRATPWTVLIAPDGTVIGNGVMTDAAEVGRMIDSFRDQNAAN